MKQGILWFDNDPHTDLSLKITRAVEYTQRKYGCKPTLCFVHPNMLNKKVESRNGLEIRANQYVLPNHFWLELMF
jgi:hypothetical protein